MDGDYQNFVDRMGSFDDTIDLSNDNVQVDTNIVTRNRSAALAHFGIPGMHWGHHSNTIKNVKWTSSDGSSNSPFKINTNTVGAAARAGQSASMLGQTVNRNGFSKKSINNAKKLTDDDLKKLTNRLNLENNYINATNQQSGRGKVDRILSTAGATMAFVSSAALMVDAINKARG